MWNQSQGIQCYPISLRKLIIQQFCFLGFRRFLLFLSKTNGYCRQALSLDINNQRRKHCLTPVKRIWKRDEILKNKLENRHKWNLYKILPKNFPVKVKIFCDVRKVYFTFGWQLTVRNRQMEGGKAREKNPKNSKRLLCQRDDREKDRILLYVIYGNLEIWLDFWSIKINLKNLPGLKRIESAGLVLINASPGRHGVQSTRPGPLATSHGLCRAECRARGLWAGRANGPGISRDWCRPPLYSPL